MFTPEDDTNEDTGTDCKAIRTSLWLIALYLSIPLWVQVIMLAMSSTWVSR